MTEDDFRRDVLARLALLEKQDAVDEVHRANVETRLQGIEDSVRWLVRLILGAFVLAIIGFAMQGGFGQ